MRRLFSLFLFLFCIGLGVSAFAEKEAGEKKSLLQEQPLETITVSEMETRLQSGDKSDILYIKAGEDKVHVYTGLATNRSLRKQIVLMTPTTELLRLYTNNKDAYQQMSRMLADYEEDNKDFDGYKVITDKDAPKKLDNGETIYRFWFMKIAREKQSRRSGFPVDIGIGIGIGGGHHHGPWIGVGW